LSIIVQFNSQLSYIGHTSFVIGGKLQRQLLRKDGLYLIRSGAASGERLRR
jgi:nucleoside-specific outer membrane channel protein Tsx